MKKIFRSTLLAFAGLSLFFGTVNAAGVSPEAVPKSDPVKTNADPSNPVDNSSATIKAALADFKNLSRKDRKLRMRDAKQELKEYNKAKRNGNAPSTNTLLLVILAILIPPLAVFLHEGVINKRFWIDLLLTLLFFLPGLIYALVVVLGKD